MGDAGTSFATGFVVDAALGIILILISAWRHSATFSRFAVLTNTLLMASGIMLTGYQLTGYFNS